MEPTAEWNADACNERSGFLFKHECLHPPAGACTACGKPICNQHTHYLDNEPHCTTCVRSDHQDRKQLRRQQRRADRHRGYDDDDDPYFYSDSYYYGYGHYRPGYWGFGVYSSMHRDYDGDDFTAADAASMAYEGDEEFESDMTES